MGVLLAGALALASVVVLAAPAPPGDPSLRNLLGQLKFSAAQIAAVDRGEPVVVNLPAPVAREVAVAGAVRIAAPASRTLDMVRNIERLERGKGFLATHKLSAPVEVSDFATFRLPEPDVDALRSCHPGDCDVKLGQAGFDLLAQVDWRARDAREQVRQLFRQMAVDYVERYRTGGNDALAVYRDQEHPTDVGREFTAMLAQSPWLTAMLPDAAAYLLRYPNARPEGAEDFFYWSLAEFGLKPIFRLNHVVILPGGQFPGSKGVITTKQLYASHYFQAALEVRMLFDDAERPGRGHYLVAVNLARVDGLTGLFGAIVRNRVRSGARNGLQSVLRTMKQRAEAGA